ncbi:hypothetical protein SPRG_00076 [Saprolegnia parasitica CBS 223.65]|uniref:JmjC domain-containing protein n=1 Tax=Saprolegnia parasitica (strain CBS 223.65) TaxID=695850 RepID=A0A067D9D4_SAPPC|nr:hypothetical protein SPRG_00076 [Saprolegnia parasitica CBS 223.65]KDO35231.1 hypothetical protein SPRG_00076 [Saprolegnia parasitica CBS 223.65]|eukprot:XP_012193582.1 hypothetical protein SPRG_00076 [Saprolegnia parasitica CBS 223.65]
MTTAAHGHGLAHDAKAKAADGSSNNDAAAMDGGTLALCICRQGYDPKRFMIECAHCDRWFHGNCVQMTEEKAFAIAQYACPSCTNQGAKIKFAAAPTKTADASLLPLPRQFASLNMKELSTMNVSIAVDKTSEKFHHLLHAGMFARSGIRRMAPSSLVITAIQSHGFQEPILVEDAVGNVPGLVVPSTMLQVDDLPNTIASSSIIKTIDNASQAYRAISYADVATLASSNQSLDEWPHNVEFPIVDTPLEYHVSPPQAVQDMDWFHQLNRSSSTRNPNTYAAVYGAGTYRDFRMNANGSSAWLHHLHGLPLWVYLIPPSAARFDKFMEWQLSSFSSSLFFADTVDKCIKCEVQPTSTLLIPSGWMYALYVPKPTGQDKPSTAVFLTSYFLHGYHLHAQMQALDFEERLGRKSAMLNTCQLQLGAWPLVTMASQFDALTSPDIVRYWMVPALQLYVQRLTKCEPITVFETLGLGQLVPLLRLRDMPDIKDMLDSLQLLLGTKDPKAPPKTLSKKDVKATPLMLPLNSFLIGKKDKKVCKCHLKKCVQCRNCVKRHCICAHVPVPSTALTGPPRKPALTPLDNSLAKAKEALMKKKAKQPPAAVQKPPSMPVTSLDDMLQWAPDDDEEAQDSAISSMWGLPPDMMNNTFFSGNELGLNMNGALELDDAFGIIDMVESSSLFSSFKEEDPSSESSSSAATSALPTPTIGGVGTLQTSANHSLLFYDGHEPVYDSEPADASAVLHNKEALPSDLTTDADGTVRHRASCHRCGNLRKKNVRCLTCPHIFCQKCAEKMVEEHGAQTFIGGCPVCKEMCCCGKNRSTVCRRKFHCYKKCPATKRCNTLTDDGPTALGSVLVKRPAPTSGALPPPAPTAALFSVKAEPVEVAVAGAFAMDFGVDEDDFDEDDDDDEDGDDDDLHRIDMEASGMMPLVSDARFNHASSLSDCDFEMELGELDAM